ncbi:DUF6252 family protein [Patiriisocius hiemis]|uniref:DUF6252 family protein n=1 Tax=Patiriisocius hiemis TaxID=3075604 RepID=A0ABU2YD63_9FLAO|nr:DUF6252 family protein [Constantimarinum sp. W242]MDT0556126.1 DUF6252 family protein [Constantimarinum sp. W242]
MKTIKKLTFLFFISLAIIACKSDDDGGDNPSNGEGSLTATVDGNSFESDPSLTQIQILNNGNVVAITGPKAQETIQFNINGYSGVGTYNMSPSNVASYGIVTDPNDPQGSAVAYVSISDGELNISEDTGSNMKGTFSFVGTNAEDPSDTVTVTNGAFNIDY